MSIFLSDPIYNISKGRYLDHWKFFKSVGIFFNKETLLTLYNAFVYPYLTYCISVWGGTYPSYMDPINKLQKRAIRIVAGSDRLAHTNSIFTELKLLSLPKIYVYYVQLFMYRHKKMLLPDVFTMFFERNLDCTGRTTRQSNLLHKIHSNFLQRSRSIRITGTNYYNHFYEKISMNVTYCTYKKNLKTYLILNTIPRLY